jgi:hypothetical protein
MSMLSGGFSAFGLRWRLVAANPGCCFDCREPKIFSTQCVGNSCRELLKWPLGQSGYPLVIQHSYGKCTIHRWFTVHIEMAIVRSYVRLTEGTCCTGYVQPQKHQWTWIISNLSNHGVHGKSHWLSPYVVVPFLWMTDCFRSWWISIAIMISGSPLLLDPLGFIITKSLMW